VGKKSLEVLRPPGSMWCGVLMPKSLVVEFDAHKKNPSNKKATWVTKACRIYCWVNALFSVLQRGKAASIVGLYKAGCGVSDRDGGGTIIVDKFNEPTETGVIELLNVNESLG